MADPARRFPSEAAFQNAVVIKARKAGFLVSHSYRGKVAGGAWRTLTSSNGFPDLCLLNRGRLILLELKMPGNKASEEQNRWIATAQTIPGVEAYVVYPAHWPFIMNLLTGTPATDRGTVTASPNPGDPTP